MQMSPLLIIKDLSISFFNNQIEKKIIKDISFQLNSNEILGIVGESGSGKSISSLAILGLLPNNISKITNGSILFNHLDLAQINSKEFQKQGADHKIFVEHQEISKKECVFGDANNKWNIVNDQVLGWLRKK